MDLNKIMFEILVPERMTENQHKFFCIGATKMFEYLKSKYELGRIPAPQSPHRTTAPCQH